MDEIRSTKIVSVDEKSGGGSYGPRYYKYF